MTSLPVNSCFQPSHQLPSLFLYHHLLPLFPIHHPYHQYWYPILHQLHFLFHHHPCMISLPVNYCHQPSHQLPPLFRYHLLLPLYPIHHQYHQYWYPLLHQLYFLFHHHPCMLSLPVNYCRHSHHQLPILLLYHLFLPPLPIHHQYHQH